MEHIAFALDGVVRRRRRVGIDMAGGRELGGGRLLASGIGRLRRGGLLYRQRFGRRRCRRMQGVGREEFKLYAPELHVAHGVDQREEALLHKRRRGVGGSSRRLHGEFCRGMP